MLKDINVEGYLYTNRTETLGKKKKTSVFADIIPFKSKKNIWKSEIWWYSPDFLLFIYESLHSLFIQKPFGI